MGVGAEERGWRGASPAAARDIEKASPLLCTALEQLLNLVRPLSFQATLVEYPRGPSKKALARIAAAEARKVKMAEDAAAAAAAEAAAATAAAEPAPTPA